MCPRGTETGPSAIQCIVLSTAGSPLAAAAEGNKWPSRALTPLTGCELLGDFARGGVNTEEILGSTLTANKYGRLQNIFDKICTDMLLTGELYWVVEYIEEMPMSTLEPHKGVRSDFNTEYMS